MEEKERKRELVLWTILLVVLIIGFLVVSVLLYGGKDIREDLQNNKCLKQIAMDHCSNNGQVFSYIASSYVTKDISTGFVCSETSRGGGTKYYSFTESDWNKCVR